MASLLYRAGVVHDIGSNSCMGVLYDVVSHTLRDVGFKGAE